MERYSVSVDKDSGIESDSSDWSDGAQFILNQLMCIIRVSVELVSIVKLLLSRNEHKPA